MFSTNGSMMYARAMSLSTLVALLALLSGCGNDVVGSKNVATSEMYVDMNIWSFDERIILATTDIKKGGASSDTLVNLEEGDQLVASLVLPQSPGSGGDLFDQINEEVAAYKATHKVMDAGSEGEAGIPYPYLNTTTAPYRARFESAKDGDTFTIALERADFNDAPNSTVVLPTSFSITTPLSGINIPRSADLVITWAPGQEGALVKLSAEMVCLTGTRGSWSQPLIIDTGMVTIPANTFTATEICDLVIIVDRILQGTIDPNYGRGGTILAHQSRFVTAKSTP